MTLVETATALKLRLDSAAAAAARDDLLSRGRTLRDEIASAAEHLEAAQAYRVTIDSTDITPLDESGIRQALGRFRAAITRSGPEAFQHQPAATLQKVVATQIKRVDRWIDSTWRQTFAAARELLERLDSDELQGSTAAMAKARRPARAIEGILEVNPVRDRLVLERRLNSEGLGACLERVNELVKELRTAIAAIDRERAAMTPEVQAALRRAASGDGLPLGEVTAQLLAALRSADVLADLVVRRS